ncbi:MAG: N-acetylglucosamine-6-phosphate deacetylase [Opitutaceae bacterium]|nr:N-acetylglucosamine-6-phosphate deacetylase [Opitutaceae bacterium]
MTYFDHQVNGFAGVDFQSPGLGAVELDRALSALRARGTRILLTLITAPVEQLERQFARIESLLGDSAFAEVVAGYHLEGPYLSPLPGFHGAHPAELMKAPDLREFDRLHAAARGRLRLVTLAPEWPGSASFVRELSGRGICTSIGHSDAGDAAIDAAIDAGLRLCTHLGNGVPGQLPRHDNIMQRLLARDELVAAFIPDGVHLPPAVLKNFVRAKPRDRVIFTTDCMAAAGAGPGRYSLGRLNLDVGEDGVVREPGKTNFAGSSLTMDRACANVQRHLGWSAEEATAACGERAIAVVGLGPPDDGSGRSPGRI